MVTPEIGTTLTLLALFCSTDHPATIVLPSYDVMGALRDAQVPTIGGFQTPLERDWLALLLRGTQPVAICPARSVEGMRIPKEHRRAVAEGRLRYQSPFGPEARRPTMALAERRNAFVLEQASAVFVAHASPGGMTERVARMAVEMGKPVWTLEDVWEFGARRKA